MQIISWYDEYAPDMNKGELAHDLHLKVQVMHQGKIADIMIPYAIFEAGDYSTEGRIGLNLVTRGHYM